MNEQEEADLRRPELLWEGTLERESLSDQKNPCYIIIFDKPIKLEEIKIIATENRRLGDESNLLEIFADSKHDGEYECLGCAKESIGKKDHDSTIPIISVFNFFDFVDYLLPNSFV